jgi:hypothetical protein
MVAKFHINIKRLNLTTTSQLFMFILRVYNYIYFKFASFINLFISSLQNFFFQRIFYEQIYVYIIDQ